MVKRNIKIPLIVINNNPSKSGKMILKNIIKRLENSDIPYIVYSKYSFFLYFKEIEYRSIEFKDVKKITDVCIVIESDYSNDIVNIVDIFLQLGKDILCFPTGIYNKRGIFSNNLIRDGAICVTSEYMCMEYLTS